MNLRNVGWFIRVLQVACFAIFVSTLWTCLDTHVNQRPLSIEDVKKRLWLRNHGDCVGFQRTEFCTAHGPPVGKMLGCMESVPASHSGVCLCSRNITVEKHCERGRVEMTCLDVCAAAVRNPTLSMGRFLSVTEDSTRLKKLMVNDHTNRLVSNKSKSLRVRSLPEPVANLYNFDAPFADVEPAKKPAASKWPGREELKKYGWPSQGGTYAGEKPKAVYIVLSIEPRKNRLIKTLRAFEDTFNKKLGYPYVVFNDKIFSESYKTEVSAAVSTHVTFPVIPEDHWSVPAWINKDKMNKGLKKHPTIPYMDSLSYRLMCRWNSGFFFREEALAQYDYFWRVDDDVFYYCPAYYDPFVLMKEKKRRYGFTIALTELMPTIKTLWKTVEGFMRQKGIESKWPNHAYLKSGKYSGCHFWSNFEIGTLEFFRQPLYVEFFEYLDKVRAPLFL